MIRVIFDTLLYIEHDLFLNHVKQILVPTRLHFVAVFTMEKYMKNLMRVSLAGFLICIVTPYAQAYESSFEWVPIKSRTALGYGHLKVTGDFGPLSIINGLVEGYLPIQTCVSCGWFVGDFLMKAVQEGELQIGQNSVSISSADSFRYNNKEQMGHTYQMSLYKCALPTGVGITFMTQENFKLYLDNNCQKIGESPTYTITRRGAVINN